MSENISGMLQENVLTLLCFDDAAAKLIRGSIQSHHFESVYFRDIASVAISFIDNFGVAIKEHLPDELEHLLTSDDQRKAKLYKQILSDLFLSKESINREYVLSQLEKFLRQQTLKIGLISAVEELQNGNLDQAEEKITAALKSRLHTFDPGTMLWDQAKSLSFYDKLDVPSIPMGIQVLDELHVGPREGELCIMIAPPKRGKTWWLINCGKSALLARKKVLHITLEMAEHQIAQRYIQALFSVTKRDATTRLPRLHKDATGTLISVDHVEVQRVALHDPTSRKYIGRKLKSMEGRLPLVIKQFPTGMLTIAALNGYLEMLETTHKFIPDIILLDYADLMKVGSDNMRADIGNLYKDLRGVAVERNLAMVSASQGNRLSASARVITDDMVAEDWSKIATSDTVLTYNQTAKERELGLARIYVSNARSEFDKITVLIAQAYSVGQFSLDSALMQDEYWSQILGDPRGGDDEGEKRDFQKRR
jgi:replicative DNA helicase